MDNANAQSVIAPDVEITGSVKCASGIRIDGKLDGELDCEKDVVIGKSAVIKGNLNVNAIAIEGTINGNVTAKDRIEMKSSARLTGDIKAKRLAVEDGVMFVGKSEVNPSGAAVSGRKAEPAAPKPAAPAPEPAPEAAPKPDAAKGGGMFGRR